MSNRVKMLIVRSLLVLFFVTTGIFTGLFIKASKDLKTTNNALTNLQEINQTLTEETVENFVVLTVILEDDETFHYFVSKSLEISVYDFLLTQGFTANDFASFDGENYYFNNALTDVLELKSNENFYTTDEWGTFLTVGLQAVILNQNLTVIRSAF